MNRLAILGASGHGKVVADAAVAAGWHTVAFFDDRWPEARSIGPWPVLGTTDALRHRHGEFDGVVVAIGDNQTRLRMQRELSAAGLPFVSVTHPSAVVSPHARIGTGSVVLAGAVVGAFAVIGVAGIVNTGATIDHDDRIGDGVHVGPGAHLGGNVVVGEGAWIGIGAAIRHGLSVGADAVVGAGAAVVKDVAAHLTVGGVPARTLNRHDTP
jgi:sugar O-acyltransferase (sialic acid O-acetyltransferase NeuD family)